MRSLVLLLIGLALCLCRCGDDTPQDPGMVDDSGQGERASSSFGAVLVRLSLLRPEPGSAPKADHGMDISGLFVRHHQIDRDSVMRVLDIPLEVRGEEVVGECQPLYLSGYSSDLPEQGDDKARISLLDGGRITVGGPSWRVRLRPKAFPDVLDFLFGVSYGTYLQGVVDLREGEEVGLAVEGGDDVGAVQTWVKAPAPIRLLRVQETDPEVEHPVFWVGSPLRLRWSPADLEGKVIVELRWHSLGAVSGVSCVVEDLGVVEIPAGDLVGLPDPLQVSEANLVLRRPRSRGFRAEGLERGWFLLETMDTVPLVLR